MLARDCLCCLLEKPLPESTRREALDAADHGSQAVAADQFRLFEQLVDMITPNSDAPGARKAGVAAMIDEDADAESEAAADSAARRSRRDDPL